jgi:bile acid:Na+ symporter, BASS family
MSDNFFSAYLMPVAIAFIMFGVGLNLRVSDFQNTFKRPNAVITGLAAQIIILPIIAFSINAFFDVNPIYKVGLILIAACPGGTTSNLVTLFLRGNLALSVTLTAFNSFIILFTIPLIVHLALYMYEGLNQNIEMPVIETAGNMLATILLPTAVGMIVRYIFAETVLRFQKTINIVMSLFLLFVFLGIFIFEKAGRGTLSEYTFLLIPTFLLNLVSMFAGYFLALKTGTSNKDRYTIAIQVGLQNSALAIYVAGNILAQPEMAVVAVIYSSFTLISTTLWAFIMKKYLYIK